MKEVIITRRVIQRETYYVEAETQEKANQMVLDGSELPSDVEIVDEECELES